uniref:Uncharacterized protein n=1 Tax=Streptomyces griseoviridis TaxID=45398 RepID=B6VRS0_STRGD|nr:hypothetical protein [Streptomyces griseoviridis]
MAFTLPATEIEDLEAQVQAALRAADHSGLTVLGYGEVSLVLALETGAGSFACKRLPVFPGAEQLKTYERSLAEYIQRLRAAGVTVADSDLWHRQLPSGGTVAYVVQEVLPAKRLVSQLLHSEDDEWAEDFFTRFLDRVEGAVSPVLGLDAQASNWVDLDGELVYLDITTPLMRDARGRERLDVRLFYSSLPWALRDVTRLTMTGSILNKFYEPRGVVLDFLGNLHKERLSARLPRFLEQANARLPGKPITADEVSAYYKGDARMWELLQRLRRADRLWHRKIRRRVYPFLLPPDVAR